MQTAFQTYINQQTLFQPNDKILLAVSGGKDSVVMVDLFHRANFQFAIAHCNFQLRGEESEKDEDFVKNLTEKHQIPFFTTKFDTKKYANEHNLSTQMAARELRYEWFEKIRKENNFDFIAVAHHLNDSIETILLNLTKGTGIAGLRGILPKNGNIIRPLLFASREEIDKYVAENQLEWREDSSNASDDYQRNLLRHQVIPILKQINPNLEATFERNIERFQALETDFQKNLQYFKTTVLRKENETVFLKIENIKYWQSANYFLEELLKEYNFNYFQSKEIYQSLEKQSGKTFFSPTHTLIKDRNELIISENNNLVFEEILIEENTKEIHFLGKKMNFDKIENFVSDKENYSELRTVATVAQNSEFIDFEKLTFPLKIRKWQVGDSFIPLGMKGKKKISDFLIDKKIPLHLKKVIFLLLSDNQVVWVIGHRIDERFKVTEATKQVLHIRIH